VDDGDWQEVVEEKVKEWYPTEQDIHLAQEKVEQQLSVRTGKQE
jgi:hypothetical protein